MRITSSNGSSLPLWFDDITSFTSIATADYSPIATYLAGSMTTADASLMGKFIRNGFGVKNATDTAGYIYAITWRQYQDYLKTNKENPNVITGIVPRKIDLQAGEWCLTPLIKVCADNHATYPSTVTTLNIGTIL